MAVVNRHLKRYALAWGAGVLACAALATPLQTETTDSERYTQAAEPTNHDRFQQALELEREGNTEAAFLEYLTISGAEYAAAKLARPEPDQYLPLLETSDAPTPVVQLLKGDLLLAKGDREGALVCYRAVAASIATDYQTGWAENRVPWNYYFVEADDPDDQLHEPFSRRIGNQDDNWLIRRFIDLGSMDDAEQEFARIWALHQHDAQPYAVLFPSINPKAPKQHLTFEPGVANPNAHDVNALNFALDYAHFLQNQGKDTEALSILLAPLLKMDLDYPPNAKPKPHPTTGTDVGSYPPKARSHPTSYSGRGLSFSMSREEYIQRAYVSFKQAEKEDEINAALQREIEKGNSAARLTLARIRMQQQDIEGSLALELAYIRVAEFDHTSATYRRGIAYETHQQLEKAAEKYEALLPMNPTGIPNLPGRNGFNLPKQNRVRLFSDGNRSYSDKTAWGSVLTGVVIPRLQRIYTAQGKTEKSLALSREQFNLAPYLLSDFDLVSTAAKQHAAADQKDAFETWATEHLQQETNQTHRANLYWALGDPENTLEALSGEKTKYGFRDWKSRFQKQYPEWYPVLLKKALAADPSDSETRLQQLDTRPDPLAPDAIEELEQLLAPGAKSAFPRGKGAYNRTRFKGYNDLAYRLVQLYEQEGRTDDLLALGERVAQGEKPCAKLETYKRNDTYFEKYIAADLEGILSLLLHYADVQTLERLAEAWKDLPDFPSKRQLERKQRGGFATESAPPIPWANLPEGVEALASSENVLSLTADDHYVYSGHPWGIAVYDHEGNPVVRVALGAAALTIETCGEFTWVGTPLGLWRIEPETWAVAHLRMDQDVPERDREEGRVDFHNGTLGLAGDGDYLWIGTRRDVRRLDLKNGILRIFSKRELGVKSHHDWKRILIEKDHVWFGGREACLRYNRVTESWTKVECNQTPAHLTGNYWDRNDDPMESPIPAGLRTGTLTENQDGSWSCYDDVTHRHTVFGVSFPASNWALLSLTNGVRVLGGSHADSPRYIYLNEDRPNSSYRTRQRAIHSGGLYFISTNDSPRRVSSSPAANAIPSDFVYTVTTGAGNERRWLCGDSGISLLTSDHKVLENIQRADGLPASRIIQATNRNDKTWFTSSTGDLISLDRSTVFRPFLKEDTKATEQNRIGPDEITREPLLGGFVVTTSRVDTTTFTCGTRGLIIFEGAAPPTPISKPLEVEVHMDKTMRLVAEAKALKVEREISLERLKELLEHENPFVRAEALGSAAFSDAVLQSLEFPSLLEPYLSDNEPRIRCTAVYALTRCTQDDAVIPLLENQLASPDKRLRAIATIDLCRRGQLPDIKYLHEILNEGDSYGNHPFGSYSTIGVQVSRERLIQALAPSATPEVFALMLELYTPSLHNYDNETKVYPQLGASLLRHPEASEILLSAYDTREYSHSRRDFAMHVFQFAGTNMLESLHVALESDDRVVRSNAARACGAIGDPSSIEPLFTAWDLPSGLSRASIVWALGELNATEAVPLLENAYFTTRAEEKRQRGPGQRLFSSQPQRIVRKNLKPYIAEQDEATENEEHISSRGVLRAMEKIDPAASETFYKTLAADNDSNAREAAAERLALAPDREKNIAILRSLLADENRGVQQTAAASLLLLGDPHAESYFLKWLGSRNHYSRNGALRELARIESPEALAFAHPALEKIATSNPSGYYEAQYEPKRAKELLAKTAAPGAEQMESAP